MLYSPLSFTLTRAHAETGINLKSSVLRVRFFERAKEELEEWLFGSMKDYNLLGHSVFVHRSTKAGGCQGIGPGRVPVTYPLGHKLHMAYLVRQ